jgi:hypothetical protein
MQSIPTGDPDSLHPNEAKYQKTIESNNLECLSMGKPTYCPSDMNTLSDLVAFSITKGIP